MTRTQNMNTRFRAALRNELPVWIQEGIVSEETAEHLSTRYQLANLKEESSRLLSAVIFTIGGLLLGGGLISFVAANWEDISTPLKLTLLVAALLGFHITGFWLWRERGWSRLGHALIFCGCLVFGANIGLVAQIFHISGDWYGAFGAWALGSLVMAWAIRSWLVGVLVLGTSLIWFIGLQDDHHEQLALLYPPAIAISLLPLAWVVRSRVLYSGTLLGLITAAIVLTSYHGTTNQLLAMAGGGWLMWTLGGLHRAIGRRGEFANVTAGLGLGVLATTAYVWSFLDLWSASRLDLIQSSLPVLLLVLSVAGSFLLLRRERHAQRWPTIGVLAVGAILCGSALLASAQSNHNADVLFTIATNLAALALASVIIGISLAEERRSLFWLGSLYLVLLVLSRFLEYETSLLVKSAAFLACGVAVILAGIRYEKYLRRKDSRPTGDSGKETAHE